MSAHGLLVSVTNASSKRTECDVTVPPMHAFVGGVIAVRRAGARGAVRTIKKAEQVPAGVDGRRIRRMWIVITCSNNK